MIAASGFRPSFVSLAGCLALAMTLGTPAMAAPLDSVFACAETDDAEARLACYDAAVGSLREANASGELMTVTRSEVEAVERDAFGFNLPTLPRLRGLFGGGDESSDAANPPKQNALTAPVVKPDSRTKPVLEAEAPQAPSAPKLEFKEVDEIVQGLRSTKEFGGSRRIRFYLDNGQVWDQRDTLRIRIPKERKGRKNTVEIRKAALGSYLLRVNGEGAAIRVNRVR